MLKSYEAIYRNGQIQWLDEQPEIDNGRIIVTILEETGHKPQKRRLPSDAIAGKAATLGDIISPLVDEEDWECLK
jgi:hypothetical protein